MPKDVGEQNQGVLAPPVVLIDSPAKSLSQSMRTCVLRFNPVGREGFPDPLVGGRHGNWLIQVTITPLVNEDQAGVIGGNLQLPPYPPGQLQEVSVDVGRSFLPGLTLLDDKLVRLNLIPPELEDVTDAESEVDAGTDQ